MRNIIDCSPSQNIKTQEKEDQAAQFLKSFKDQAIARSSNFTNQNSSKIQDAPSPVVSQRINSLASEMQAPSQQMKKSTLFQEQKKLTNQLSVLSQEQNVIQQNKISFSSKKSVSKDLKAQLSQVSNHDKPLPIKDPSKQIEKEQKIHRQEEIKKKLGISNDSKTASKKKSKGEGFGKLCFQRMSKWFSDKFQNCCKRKAKDKLNESEHPSMIQRTNDGKSEEIIYEEGESKHQSFGSSGIRMSLKQRMKQAGQLKTPRQSKTQKENEEMLEVTKTMSREKLMEKAYRHLLDGLLYRNPRHDLDGEGQIKQFVKLIWKIQNSNLWNDFLLLLGWVYIFMSFLEPSNRNDASLPQDLFEIMVGVELFILTLQTLDLIMELIQRSTQSNTNILKVIIQRKKNFFRLLFFLLNTADLIQYATSYPVNTFRFARIIRPLQIIIFSKQLRRNFQGIINSVKQLLMILVLDIIITCFFAYIGVNMLGDSYNDEELDTYAIDFRDFAKSANAMYIFSSLDLYPDILFPSIQSSYYYLLYFLPYLLLFLFLFAPIPTAVVYDGYRKHRLNLLIADRVKRRKALWICYQCIASDNKKSYLPQNDFMEFFKFAYLKVELEDVAEVLADILWSELDANDNKKVSVEEFFKVLDITEQRSELRLQRIRPIESWVKFREKVDEKFHLEEIINGKLFEYISFLVTIGSCITTVVNLFSETTPSYVDSIDKGFFAFFCIEIIIKMIGFGPDGFFKETWNVFDLSLVLFQVFFDYVFYTIMSGSNVKSVSASRVLKIAKLQKAFRMFRALRTAKILNYIFSGLDIIHKVYEMLYKIVICIPVVMKLSTICVIFFYIYAVIGVELFSSNLKEIFERSNQYGQNMCAPNTNAEDYTYCEYATFDSFGGAILVLLQVCVGSGWSYIQFGYSKKFDDFATSSFFFNSFHFLSVFVLSLIGGLIWEVFDVVEKIMRDKQAYDTKLEMQRDWEEQQQKLEGSFQSGVDQQKKTIIMNLHKQTLLQSKIPHLKSKMQMTTINPPEDDDEQDDDQDQDQEQENGENKENKENKETKEQPSNPFNPKKNIFAMKMKTISSQQSKEEIQQKEKTELDQALLQIDNTDTSQSEEEEEEEEFESDDGEEENQKSTQNGTQTQQPLQSVPNKQDKEKGMEKYLTSEGQQNLNQGNKWLKLRGPKIPPKLSQNGNYETPIFQTDQNASPDITEINGDQGIGSKGYLCSIGNQKNKIEADEEIIQFKKAIINGVKPKTLKRKVIKLRKRRVKRKNKKEEDELENQDQFQDNQKMTQRDKGQLILFQDLFKMTTLDLFFKHRQIPEPYTKYSNENPSSQIKIIKQEKEEENNKQNNQNGSGVKYQFHSFSIHEDKSALNNRKSFQFPIDSSDAKLNGGVSHDYGNRVAPRFFNSITQGKDIEMNGVKDKNTSLTSISQIDIEENPLPNLKHKDTSKNDLLGFYQDNYIFSKRNIGDSPVKNKNDISSGNSNFPQQNFITFNDQTFRKKLSLGEQGILVEASNNISQSKKVELVLNSNQKSVVHNRNKPLYSDIYLNQTQNENNNQNKNEKEIGSKEEVSYDKQFKGFRADFDNNSIASPQNIGAEIIQSCKESERNDFILPPSEYFPSRILKNQQNKNEIQMSKEMPELKFVSPKELKYEKQILDAATFRFSKKEEEEEQKQREPHEKQRKQSSITTSSLLNPIENSIKSLGNNDTQTLLQHEDPILENDNKIKSEETVKSSEESGSKGDLLKKDIPKNTNESARKNQEQILIHQTPETPIPLKIEQCSIQQQPLDKIAKGKNLLLSLKGQQTTNANQSLPIANPSEYFMSERNEDQNITLNRTNLGLMLEVDGCLSHNNNNNNNINNFSKIQEVRGHDYSPESEHTNNLFSSFVELRQQENLDEQKLQSKEQKYRRRFLKKQLREKHKAEMEGIFKSTLLDVDLQGGSLSSKVQNPLFSQVVLSSKQKNDQTGMQRDLIKDLPMNKLLKQYILNINQNMKEETSVPLRIDLSNMNYIINSAILKQVNEEKVNKIEIKHFKHLYGSQFEDIIEEDVSQVWSQQAKLLFHLDNLFKFDHIPIQNFIQLYCSIEMQISALLMNKFSSMKIIYQNQDDEWFTINFFQESYFLQEILKEGPWSFFEALFNGRDQKRLLKHRNLYSLEGKSDYAKQYLKKAFKTSQDISNNFYFRKLQINQKRSDLIYIPLPNDHPEEVRQKALNILKFQSEFLPEYIRKEDLTVQQMPLIKKALVVTHLFDNPIVKDRKAQFASDELNLTQALIEDDVLQKDLVNATLNYTYSVEFLKDIKNHLNMFKEQLFTKITQFYCFRYCFEKNFSDMQQVPFE